MQDSSLVDNSAAFGAKWQHVRKKSRFLGCLNPPKRLCFSIVQFLGYLKRCHQAYVVELDLSFVRLVNQVITHSFNYLLYSSFILIYSRLSMLLKSTALKWVRRALFGTWCLIFLISETYLCSAQLSRKTVCRGAFIITWCRIEMFIQMCFDCRIERCCVLPFAT